MSTHGKHIQDEIPQTPYCPPVTYPLDLEIFSISDLRARVDKRHLSKVERIEFNLLLYVATGRCNHAIDFTLEDCGPGSLILVQPGQTHRFDALSEWDGWLVLFRPEFLYPLEAMALLNGLEQLPAHLVLQGDDRWAVTESIRRMHLDTRQQADTNFLHTLLRNQLCALLTRVQLIHSRIETEVTPAATTMHRFKRFKQAVDQHHQRLHRVQDYARLLGCSEKTLNRDTQEILGIGAKTFVTRRIVLEAKRLLIHTNQPISSIAHQLGFDEVTNFFKVFKREAGHTPGDLRRGV